MSLCRASAYAALITLLFSTVSYSAVSMTENEALTKGDDPRLDQKVTISAEGARLADVLAQLSDSTGVTMNAGLDKDDWMVYDRKLILYVKDMKLVDLMREIASILRFHWSRGGESGKWTYRLWQDKEQRLEEESLRASAEDSQAKAFREKRENAIADMVNLGSLAQADAAKLKSSDPWRYVLATEPLGRDVAAFMDSFPEARSAFVQGQEASFPVSSLPPELQEGVRRIATSYDALARSIGASEDHSELLSHFEKLQVTINRKTLGQGSDVYSRSLLGRIMIGSADESLEIPLFDPRSPMARALGSAIVALKSGKDKSHVGAQLEADLRAAATSGQTTSDAPARDITSDPSLSAKVKLFSEPRKTSLPAVLRLIAEKSGLDVVSDYFLGPPTVVQSGERPLGEQLEIIRAAFGANWEKAGGRLRFRDTQWFAKRAWEVPEVWLQYWIARAKANDGLQLQDFVDIASRLRDEQIDHTVMMDPDLVTLGAGDAARNREILRFYRSLSPQQQASLSGGGLDASALTDEQWEGLRKALATKGAAYAAVSRGNQILRLTQTTSGEDITVYKFAFHPGSNEPPVVFQLTRGVAAAGVGASVFEGKKAIKVERGTPAPTQ